MYDTDCCLQFRIYRHGMKLPEKFGVVEAAFTSFENDTTIKVSIDEKSIQMAQSIKTFILKPVTRFHSSYADLFDRVNCICSINLGVLHFIFSSDHASVLLTSQQTITDY
jgi:hypothetical protein